MFPFEDIPEENFEVWLETYTQDNKTPVHRCDYYKKNKRRD